MKTASIVSKVRKKEERGRGSRKCVIDELDEVLTERRKKAEGGIAFFGIGRQSQTS